MTSLSDIRYKRLLLLIFLYGSFLIFLFTTDPTKMAVGWLILPFIWLFISLFLTFLYLIDWFSPTHKHDRRQTITAALLAAVPTVMLLLDSVDQLTIKDFLLIVGLGILAAFYISKIRLKKDIF